jgi:hypothetical protein
MEKYHWTLEQYLNRPLWFDVLYEIKCRAEAKYQEVKAPKNDG